MNNMEEDIKILEDLKKDFIKDFISLVSKKDGFVIEKDKRKKQIRAIENIINRNRYLETKAAAEINNETNNIKVEIFKNYIPISSIEEELKELDKKEKQELKGLRGQDRFFVKQMYQYRKDSLQKILEKWAKNRLLL